MTERSWVRKRRLDSVNIEYAPKRITLGCGEIDVMDGTNNRAICLWVEPGEMIAFPTWLRELSGTWKLVMERVED